MSATSTQVIDSLAGMTWEKWQAMTPAEKDRNRDSSNLDPRFERFYRSGERIELTTHYENGETWTRRGYVSRTTGWRPSYILMNNSRSMGSSDLLSARDKYTIRTGVSTRRRPR